MQQSIRSFKISRGRSKEPEATLKTDTPKETLHHTHQDGQDFLADPDQEATIVETREPEEAIHHLPTEAQ